MYISIDVYNEKNQLWLLHEGMALAGPQAKIAPAQAENAAAGKTAYARIARLACGACILLVV